MCVGGPSARPVLSLRDALSLPERSLSSRQGNRGAFPGPHTLRPEAPGGYLRLPAQPGSPAWGGHPCADTLTAHSGNQCFARHPGFQKVTEEAAHKYKARGEEVFSFRRRHERHRGAGRGLDLTQRWVWPSHGRIRRGRKWAGPQRGGGSLGPPGTWDAMGAAVRLQEAQR